MGYLIYLFFGVFLGYLFNSLTKKEKSDQSNKFNTKNKIIYYSNGNEIPLSFSKEYKIIVKSMFGKSYYNDKLVSKIDNYNICELELLRTFVSKSNENVELKYNFETIQLAKEYLDNEQSYLNNLN